MQKKNTNVSIKVLYISHEGDSVGGAFFSLLNLINSLKEKVCPVVIVPLDGMACQELKNRGIKYFVVPFSPTFTHSRGIRRVLLFVPRYIVDYYINYHAAKKIQKIIKAENIDLIHSNSSAIDIGYKISAQLKIKHVWHIREFLNLDFNCHPFIGWSRFLKKINRSDAVICVTRCVYEHFKLTDKQNAYVIFNAVRLRHEVNLNCEKKDYLLFCGNIIKSKGIEDAIKAFSIIHQKHNHLKLVVAGAVVEKYFAQLSALIDRLNLKGAVEFLGFQKNVDNLMADALCLLMCSSNEALGRVTVEAMFNGCPVIGHSTAGTKEIIKDNETGYLYTNLEELTQRIFYVIENKESVFEITKRAQCFARDNFTEEKYSKNLMEIYSKLLPGNQIANAVSEHTTSALLRFEN